MIQGDPALDALTARYNEARSWWLDLDSGKRVRLIRPSEAEYRLQILPLILQARTTSEHYLDVAAAFSTNWEGISEADYLGQAVGSTDALQFSRPHWRMLLADRLVWVDKIASALIEKIEAHEKQRAQAEKN